MKECPACKNCFVDQFIHCPTDGNELTASIAGDTVLDGRYLLEKRLGQGGMGIVFRARHVFLKTPYAIKVILPDLVGNDPMLATRFRQEAMVAARIGHRNIVNVTDFGVVGGKMPYLVMDLIIGRSLHDMLVAEKRLGPGPALEIMSALCAGVGAAHGQGIIHRDLKPLNVMMQEKKPVSEAVKVLDFGLAKIKSGELLGSFVAAQTTGLMGSPYYMAPELWSDDEPDARSDIYSLGVILYQMLAGDVPFKGPSLPAIMKKHLSDSPPPFTERGVNVSPAIEHVVSRALAKRREDRMSSVEEFIAELREAVDSAQADLYRISREVTKDLCPETMRFEPDADRTVAGLESLGQPSWDSQTRTDSQQRIEDEADRLAREFEEAQRRADEARLRAEEAARKRAEEEAARKRAEEEAARKLAEEEAARQRVEDMARKRAEEAAARRRADEEAARKLAAEEERKKAEDAAARRRVEEEAVRLAKEVTEAKERAKEARLIAESEARKRSEEQVARKRAEEEAQRLALEVAEAQKRAQEARNRADEEARNRAAQEELWRQEEEEEERRRAEASIRIHAEGEVAKKKAAEEADRLAREVAEAQRRADEAGIRAQEESRKRAEAEGALSRAEEEARKLAQQMEELQQRAEESRRRSEDEAAKRSAQEEVRRKEEERQRLELLQLASQAQHPSQDPSRAFQQSTAPHSQSGFNQSAAANQLAISEETVVRSQQLSGNSAADWDLSRGFDRSVPATAAKKSFAIPVILGVVALFAVILIGGGVLLFSTNLFGTKTATNQPVSQPTATATNTPVKPAPVKPEMVRIEGGTFQMGLSEVPTKEFYDLIQTPTRVVRVKSFMIDKTEVTNAEYADFVAGAKYPAPSYWNNGKPPAGQEQWPVTNVSLADAKAFADWRSKGDGQKYRLPTEEEWEYAARNGSQNDIYPWGNEWLEGRANMDSNALKPVGTYPQGASRTGVLDLIGNVWEWTSTKAAAYPGNPSLSIPSGQVIIRGGAFIEPSKGPEAITATRRSWISPNDKQAAIGFRLVRD